MNPVRGHIIDFLRELNKKKEQPIERKIEVLIQKHLGKTQYLGGLTSHLSSVFSLNTPEATPGTINLFLSYLNLGDAQGATGMIYLLDNEAKKEVFASLSKLDYAEIILSKIKKGSLQEAIEFIVERVDIKEERQEYIDYMIKQISTMIKYGFLRDKLVLEVTFEIIDKAIVRLELDNHLFLILKDSIRK